jgi:hypothetical protein
MSTFDAIKDPEEILDYKIIWTDWLEGDTIITSSFAVDPTGALTIDSETNTTTEATVWLSGGDRGRKYKVTNHIVTAGGRESDRTILFEIKDR